MANQATTTYRSRYSIPAEGVVALRISHSDASKCRRYSYTLQDADARKAQWFSDSVKFTNVDTSVSRKRAVFTGVNDAGQAVAIVWHYVPSVKAYKRTVRINKRIVKSTMYASK